MAQSRPPYWMYLRTSERPFGATHPRAQQVKIIDLTESIKGLQITGPPTKHQKTISTKLMTHIYNEQYSHLDHVVPTVNGIIYVKLP